MTCGAGDDGAGAGLYLAVGVLEALHDRERTGTGRWVQTSLLESKIAMMDFQAARWTIDREVPPQEGNHHPLSVPMGCFASSDGYVNIGGAGGRLLDSLCQVIGLPGIPADPRFDSAAKRSANRVELNELIAGRLRTRTTAEWVQALNEAGVPCGPVYRMDEVFADPQVEHLAMTEPVQHPALGRLEILRNAVRMTDAPATVRSPSPDIGDHTDEVLTELGYPRAPAARGSRGNRGHRHGRRGCLRAGRDALPPAERRWDDARARHSASGCTRPHCCRKVSGQDEMATSHP